MPHPYLVSFLFIPSLYSLLFNSKNFSFSSFIRNNDKYSILYVANSVKCQDSKKVPFNTGAVVMMVVCLLFLLLSLVGTAVDLSIMIFHWLMEKPEFSQRFSQTGSDCGDSAAGGTPISTQATATSPSEKNRFHIYAPLGKHLKFITAFSIIKNLEMIISTKQPVNAITCFSGIRVISISWIIFVHTFTFQVNPYIQINKDYIIRHYEPKFSFQPIVNGNFSIDSFFFMSSVLSAYLTLIKMQKKEGRFPVVTYYLHRYLRPTMVYAFALFFWWTLNVHLGNGSMWRARFGKGSELQKNCQKWWTNLLYINNFYPRKYFDQCMMWS